VARRYIEPLRAALPTPRGLVLGCTHFPVLKQTIAAVAGPEMVLIDSAETKAANVAGVLEDAGLLSDGAALPPRFLATDAPGRFAHLGEIFLGEAIDPGAVTLVDL
jgi:glutamate racemase